MTYREEIKRILKTEGIKGFSAGYRAMAVRDIISFGSYFLIYDTLKNVYDPSPSLIWRLCSGGLSGAISWTLGYAFDSLKLRMQTGVIPPHFSLFQALLHASRSEEGIKGLYRGVHVQVLRALPTTAVGIVSFEMARDSMLNFNNRPITE